MNERPETKFAWNGDVALAYQVFGEGPVDLVYMQGFGSHVDLNWDSPFLARFLRGLGPARSRDPHGPTRVRRSDRFSPRRRRAARGPGRRPRCGDGRGWLRARCHLRLVRHGVYRRCCSRRRTPSGPPAWSSVRSLRDVLRVRRRRPGMNSGARSWEELNEKVRTSWGTTSLGQ